ncbi:MAG: hypothetical protein K8F91_17125, partial [Candidatus Obscuribacterales bacterium]|nr:hypothetical protein [Candidatus Obscuribacterales bacterium]
IDVRALPLTINFCQRACSQKSRVLVGAIIRLLLIAMFLLLTAMPCLAPGEDEYKAGGEALNFAEVPGRIYRQEMNIYERAKVRGFTALYQARTPRQMRHTVYNQSFQVLLDDMWTISKDPALRWQYMVEKKNVPFSAQAKMATFLKNDDWGPRKTCAELVGSISAVRSNRKYIGVVSFISAPKNWLKARLGI